MGCNQSFRRGEIKINSDDRKNFHYANKEFELSQSEDEDEILAVKTHQPRSKPQIFQKIPQASTNISEKATLSSTTRHTLLDNRLDQTPV